MLYRPRPSKQLHLAAEKRRLREVTLPKVKLLVRGPEIRTPQCLSTETRRSACAPRRPFLGLEKLPAVPLHTAQWHRASGGKAEACPEAGSWCLLCKAASACMTPASRQWAGRGEAGTEALGNSPGSEVTRSLDNLSEGSWQCPCGSQFMDFKEKENH